MKQKKLFLSILSGLLLLASSLFSQTVTIGFEGGQVFDDLGNPLADGTLLVAVSTGSSGSFSGPEIGSFTSGTEILLGSFFVDFNVLGENGGFSDDLAGISLTDGLATGQQIGIMWFPDLTIFDESLVIFGTNYGFYTDSSWLVPSGGAAVSYGFETVSIGGSIPDASGFADLTVVPEPSTYAAIVGLLALTLVGYRRFRK